MQSGVRRFSIQRSGDSGTERVLDTVAEEEPLAIRIGHWFKDAHVTEEFAVTMRTPGHDRELTAGLLLSEGVIGQAGDIDSMRALGSEEASNEILVELAKGVDFEAWRAARAGLMSSSCGVCGKRSREAITDALPVFDEGGFQIDAALVERLPGLLSEQQQAFSQTGGLHAAAAFSTSGDLRAIFEDIGRHNALDKLIGWAVWNGRLPLDDQVLFLSSRSSFELIQKAAMAGARVLATVGGPSSLAIETARQVGMTLIGFVRGGRFNIYSGEWRVHS